VDEPVNVADYEELARARLDPGAYGYYVGGANDELTLRDNVEAYRRWQLRPRVLRDVGSPSTAATVLGEEVALPVLVAPVAYQRAAHPQGELGMAEGARAAGTIMCLSTFATTSPADVAATGVKRWFQLYVPRNEELGRELCRQAAELGFGALVVTVDLPVSGRRERDHRSGWTLPARLEIPSVGLRGLKPHEFVREMSPSVTWDDVGSFAAEAGLPVILKGILTAEDALRAREAGVDGIVVSNHGGRQVDGAVASLDALVEVRDALPEAVVLMDGGIRCAADVVKAMALGADAVLLGRPYAYALAVGGQRGVEELIQNLMAEIDLTLALAGGHSIRELDRSWLTRV